MSCVVLFTYAMIMARGGVAEISVCTYHEAIWEFPLLGMGFVWYLLQAQKKPS